MKRFVALFIMTIVVGVISMQEVAAANSNDVSASAAEQVVSMSKTDWLTDFTKIKVDAPINLTLKQVPAGEEVRIVYDTKGNLTSKFKYEVDKNGTLVISEKVDPKRLTVTDVVVYYKTLSEVKIARATAEFESEVVASVFDLSVSNGATVVLSIKTLDAAVECTGTSSLVISGETKYLTMRVSTAKVDCGLLSTVSTTVEASHSAEVRVMVSERLEATTSTNGKLLYRGSPTILRNHNALFGGGITNVN